MKKELEAYKIKELDDPKKMESVTTALKDGERPIVTVATAEGADKKLRIEAAPRFFNINFFELSGKPEKREQHLKVPKQEKEMSRGRSNNKENQLSGGIGM